MLGIFKIKYLFDKNVIFEINKTYSGILTIEKKFKINLFIGQRFKTYIYLQFDYHCNCSL